MHPILPARGGVRRGGAPNSSRDGCALDSTNESKRAKADNEGEPAVARRLTKHRDSSTAQSLLLPNPCWPPDWPGWDGGSFRSSAAHRQKLVWPASRQNRRHQSAI